MKTAIVIGAGPAGLTAALELLRTTDIKPIVYEADTMVGGISKTLHHNGNRIDIGGHRFFSKNDAVMNWWQDILPLQGAPSKDDLAIERKIPLKSKGPDPESDDRVMLYRSRLSRILYLRRLFDYPVTLNGTTIRQLGLWRIAKIGLSYTKTKLLPARTEKNLEDFMINRFGKELYLTFFKDYTEKVWGVPCTEISPEWGGQRIKGLSVSKTLLHALKSLFSASKKAEIGQKDTETSLIGQFLYPKFGPGQLWETVAQEIQDRGGEIHLNTKVTRVFTEQGQITKVAINHQGQESEVSADYFLSTMPIKDLVAAMDNPPPAVQNIAAGLIYRDFMTVGVLLDRLDIKKTAKAGTPESKLNFVADNWIYVQESDVKLGRIQIFNNWSPYLVADPSKAWLGLEYFANEGDELWNMSDADFIEFAIAELEKIGVTTADAVRDAVLFRIPKAYPAYFGTYQQFDQVQDYLLSLANFYPMGRNGMHKYNNMDHSMLTAIETVKHIRAGSIDKSTIWNVNSEEEYHENKK